VGFGLKTKSIYVIFIIKSQSLAIANKATIG